MGRCPAPGRRLPQGRPPRRPSLWSNARVPIRPKSGDRRPAYYHGHNHLRNEARVNRIICWANSRETGVPLAVEMKHRLIMVTAAASILATLFVGNLISAELPASLPAPSDLFWSGQSGGFTITWTSHDIVARQSDLTGSVVFSARAWVENQWRQTLQAIREDQELLKQLIDLKMECYQHAELTILSIVGPVVSLQIDQDGYCGGAHPYSLQSYVALNLARPVSLGPNNTDQLFEKAAKLTDFFPDSEVFGALLNDTLVQKALNHPRLQQVHPASDGQLPDLLIDFFDGTGPAVERGDVVMLLHCGASKLLQREQRMPSYTC